MAEPVEFQIVKNMQAALQGVTIEGGYFHNFEALAVKLDPNHKVEELVGDNPRRPFVILAMSPDVFDYAERGSVGVTMPFIVHAIGDSDVEDDNSRMKTHFRLCADVEQAIAVDPTRGGLASETVILERSMRELEPEGREVWAQVAGVIRHKRRYGAPNG